MQIIIVGCGKVGRTLAEQLQEEESDITLIDVSSNVITSLQDDIDAMGIVGNGASINTLVEAGIENADILIAVTGSDQPSLVSMGAAPPPIFTLSHQLEPLLITWR